VRPRAKCSEPGCENPVQARGWCDIHYWRNFRKPKHNQDKGLLSAPAPSQLTP
jgi:hypothetical protein